MPNLREQLQRHISGRPVVNASGKLIGIISQGDFTRRGNGEAASGRRSVCCTASPVGGEGFALDASLSQVGTGARIAIQFVSRSDPTTQWTGRAFFDVKFGVIVEIEAYRAIRQAEVAAAKTMIERTEERFVRPEHLIGETVYGRLRCRTGWPGRSPEFPPPPSW